MKRNPVIPFALIAVLGIVAMIVLSVVGLNEQDKIANGGEEGETVNTDPEAISQSCIGCHGGDLEGASGPNLHEVGSKYSVDEVQEIIVNGIEGTAMPGGLVSTEEAAILAEWLVTGETSAAEGEGDAAEGEAPEEEAH